MQRIQRIILLLMYSAGLVSCQDEFLEKKPDVSLLIPATLKDFNALLDAVSTMNYNVPTISLIASDDFYSTTAGFTAWSTAAERGSYTWADDVYGGSSNTDWNSQYIKVFNANVVLDGLLQYDETLQKGAELDRVKGTALFHRAMAFFNLAQVFAKPYSAISAASDPGIPIRLTADVNLISKRGSLQTTYDQIVTDLTQAAELLPVQVDYKTRPNRAAAFALLSRVYLTMSLYSKARDFAESALALNNSLLDYNTLNASAANPLPVLLPNNNTEVLFYATLISYSFNSSAATIVDSVLYRSFATNDLRRTVYFNNRGNGVINFKGSYTGETRFFAGLATDELYLIKAECLARNGDASGSMTALNTLLQKRWKTGTFVALAASGSEDALTKVLMERRKELVARGVRWSDLRRLNTDTRFATTIRRVVNSVTYKLDPVDKRYVFPIPENEIAGSGIPQNER